MESSLSSSALLLFVVVVFFFLFFNYTPIVILVRKFELKKLMCSSELNGPSLYTSRYICYSGWSRDKVMSEVSDKYGCVYM